MLYEVITIDATPSSPTGNCILIRYDVNNDGTISGTPNTNDEILGYRYNGNDDTIEFNSWTNVADQTCATTSTGWDSLAGGDGHTNITGLTFTIDPASGRNNFV